ncbi:16S rRNA (uracil(1498)-N(3))-methyltransferase [Frigoribacterium sp. 2-23]|uniref:16S rRNA (uracil(1498)-N(3))-methyltransferase n=1 Tax=Frigoribacterium sp. 2-23 TaxID=3415006 RepID=UPI003C7030D4
MAHFYLVDDLDEARVGSRVVVSGPEARHAVTVSRVRVGESLRLGNGRGLVVEGEVEEAQGDRLTLVASVVTHVERVAPRLVLVQALAKGDRDELAVQASTELGVDEVVPWQAARSVSRWQGPKIEKGLTRWRSIVREATKQAVRPWTPRVDDLVGTKQLVARAGVSGSLVFVLEPTAELALSAVDIDVETTREVLLVVGPEGGIEPSEISQLVDAGAVPVRLGASVLRTSTAGPAALAVVNVRLGRW